MITVDLSKQQALDGLDPRAIQQINFTLFSKKKKKLF